jgi:hypothetical protein
MTTVLLDRPQSFLRLDTQEIRCLSTVGVPGYSSNVFKKLLIYHFEIPRYIPHLHLLSSLAHVLVKEYINGLRRAVVNLGKGSLRERVVQRSSLVPCERV